MGSRLTAFFGDLPNRKKQQQGGREKYSGAWPRDKVFKANKNGTETGSSKRSGLKRFLH